MLRILVIGLVLLVAAVFLIPRPVPAPANATEYPEPMAMPDVTLTDHEGNTFTTTDLEGRFHLIFFGFTNCPDICPVTMAQLAVAMRQWRDDDGEIPRVVLVSVDPARDTPSQMAGYVGNFDPQFIGLTGPESATAPWIETLGISVMRQSLEGGRYNMTHNPQVFVTNPSAELIAVMSDGNNAEVVAEDFRRIVQRHASRNAIGD